MPITGSQKALHYAFVGTMRVGATRVGYFPATAAFSIGGVTVSNVVKPSATITDELDNVPNVATVTLRGRQPSYANEILVDQPSGYWRLGEHVGEEFLVIDETENEEYGLCV